MPKFMIRTSISATHYRMVFVDSDSPEAAAEEFVKNTLLGAYDGMPSQVVFDQDSATFDIDTPDHQQLDLGLYH
jgi:DNA-binding sugar fermentation-stimulating protein